MRECQHAKRMSCFWIYTRESIGNWLVQDIEIGIHFYPSGVTIYTQNHSILDEMLVS